MAEEYDLKTDELVGKQQAFCSAGWTLFMNSINELIVSSKVET